jgi:hypothetical protein
MMSDRLHKGYFFLSWRQDPDESGRGGRAEKIRRDREERGVPAL